MTGIFYSVGILPELCIPKQSVWKQLPTRKLQTDFNRIYSYLKSDKLSSTSITHLMDKMLKEGMLAKSINKYAHLLNRAYNGKFSDWKPLSHTAGYRRCFPIASFYHFYNNIDSKIISMYAKGMTTRQISDTIPDIYGFETSEGFISDVTD